MGTLAAVAVVYGVVAVVMLIFSLAFYALAGNHYERRDAARLVLASPVWPVAVVSWVIGGIKQLVRDAR